MDSTSNASTFKGCGTRYYISPEQKDKERVDCKTDIYSLGIILFEFFYPNIKNRDQVLIPLTRRCKFPEKFDVTFPEVHKLIAQMIEHESEKRPSAHEVQNTFSHIPESSMTIVPKM